MKILKFSAMALGAAALIIGFNSCKKDKGIECCTYSYIEDGIRYSFKACEDGKMTYSYTGGETETYDWHDDYGNWSELRQAFIDYGGTCD